MAEAAEPAGSSLKVKTPFGDVVAQGFQVVLVLCFAALFWIVYDLGKDRAIEAEKIQCLIKLQIWIYTQPRGTAPQPIEMPAETWACVPEYFVRRK